MGTTAGWRRTVARLVRDDLRVAVALVVGVPLVALGAVLVLLALLTSVPRCRQARRSAQATADRLFPGEVRVIRARGLGAAGGYGITAELVADPSVPVAWAGPRRCRGGRCDAEILAAVANARDGDAERAAVVRAFTARGLAVSEEPEVLHRPSHHPVRPRTLGAVLGVAAPPTPLDDAGTADLTARLDAAVLGWPRQRAELLPTTEYSALVRVRGPVRCGAQVVVRDGRVHTSAADTLAPALAPGQRADLVAALDAPVRAFLREHGIDAVPLRDVHVVYAPGTTRRIAVRVPLVRTGGTGETVGSVHLTARLDGSDPQWLRHVSGRGGYRHPDRSR